MSRPSAFQCRVLGGLYLLTCTPMSRELRDAAQIPARQGFSPTLVALRDAGLIVDSMGLSMCQTWKLTAAGKAVAKNHARTALGGS